MKSIFAFVLKSISTNKIIDVYAEAIMFTSYPTINQYVPMMKGENPIANEM